MTKSLNSNALAGYKKQLTGANKNVLLPLLEKQALREQQGRDDARDWEHLHPSEMAKTNWCERASYYRMVGKEQTDTPSAPLNLRRVNVFTEGHRIHDKWQKWMHEAGILYGEFKCDKCGHTGFYTSPHECPVCVVGTMHYREMPIVDDDMMILGRADAVVIIDDVDYVVEIKSVGLGTVKWEAPSFYNTYENNITDMWKALKRPLQSHIRQVMLYMHFLNIDKGLVIYEWKPTQEIKEFRLTYSYDLVKEMLDKAAALQAGVMSGVAPDRPEQATGRGCQFCSMCEYRKGCWTV